MSNKFVNNSDTKDLAFTIITIHYPACKLVFLEESASKDPIKHLYLKFVRLQEKTLNHRILSIEGTASSNQH